MVCTVGLLNDDRLQSDLLVTGRKIAGMTYITYHLNLTEKSEKLDSAYLKFSHVELFLVPRCLIYSMLPSIVSHGLV